jgi:putative ABC transport system permease protein
MLFLDTFRVSTRSFKNNRLRTFLTILGISIGIGAIFFLVSLGYGFQKLILERIATSDSLLALDVTQESEVAKLNQQGLEDLKTIEHIVEISPILNQDSQISGNGFTSDVKLSIVDPNFFSLEGVETKKGELFNEEDTDGLIISTAALQLLDIKEDDGFNQNKLTLRIMKDGEFIKNPEDSNSNFIEKEYNIKGIIENETQLYVYVPRKSLSEEVEFIKFNKFKVKASSEKELANVREQIIAKGFFVNSISDTVEQMKQIFKVAQIALSLFGIIALTVSAIGMFNTMTIALLERTQEIGIMKTLGASTLDIWRMFLTESMLIGFVGGVLGLTIGYIASRVLNFGINILAKNFGGIEVELFYIPIWFVLFVLIFSTLIGLITGFYPAKRAAKLNALEALRYK